MDKTMIIKLNISLIGTRDILYLGAGKHFGERVLN